MLSPLAPARRRSVSHWNPFSGSRRTFLARRGALDTRHFRRGGGGGTVRERLEDEVREEWREQEGDQQLVALRGGSRGDTEAETMTWVWREAFSPDKI